MQERTSLVDALEGIGKVERELDDNVEMIALGEAENDESVVVEAENGRAGLECIAQECPALILVDLMMPEVDGFTFVEELRRDERHRSVPTVVITAKDLTAEDRRRLRVEPMRRLA